MEFTISFEDKVFEELVTKENKRNSAEVFPFEYKGEKYWVKKERATKSNIFHKFFYKLSNIDILVPVEDKSSKEAMLFEINKINKFNNEGIPTSKIVGVGKDFFVMSDMGIPLYKLLKKSKNKEELYIYIDKIILALSSLHSKGFYHGGAQSRNFTYLDDKISIIDFEDSFKKDISLKVLQLRDLVLFLLSMSKLKNIDLDYSYIIYKYIENTENNNFIVKLKNLSRKANFLIQLSKIDIINRILPRDVLGFVKLMKSLNKL